jgi:DNA-binding Lrp family transcriptional regulator
VQHNNAVKYVFFRGIIYTLVLNFGNPNFNTIMENAKVKSPALQLDQVDLAILKHLQANARFNMKELSDELRMTKTPIYERIKRLEQDGYIHKYVALLDRKKVGLPLMVFCAVSLSVQNAAAIAAFNEQISDMEEVVECHLTGGMFDFILKIVVRDLEAYNAFTAGRLAALPNVAKIQSSFVLHETKSSTALPLG